MSLLLFDLPLLILYLVNPYRFLRLVVTAGPVLLANTYRRFPLMMYIET